MLGKLGDELKAHIVEICIAEEGIIKSYIDRLDVSDKRQGSFSVLDIGCAGSKLGGADGIAVVDLMEHLKCYWCAVFVLFEHSVSEDNVHVLIVHILRKREKEGRIGLYGVSRMKECHL